MHFVQLLHFRNQKKVRETSHKCLELDLAIARSGGYNLTITDITATSGYCQIQPISICCTILLRHMCLEPPEVTVLNIKISGEFLEPEK